MPSRDELGGDLPRLSRSEKLLDLDVGGDLRARYTEEGGPHRANRRGRLEGDLDGLVEVGREVDQAGIAVNDPGAELAQRHCSVLRSRAARADHVPSQVEEPGTGGTEAAPQISYGPL